MTEEKRAVEQEMEMEAPEFAEEELFMTEEVTKSCCAGGDRAIPPCGDCEVEVPFCCATTLNFRTEGGSAMIMKRTLVYDPFCLSCIVTPCIHIVADSGCPEIDVTLYEVRVRGSISFIANAEFLGGCGGEFNADGTPGNQNSRYNVCCEGSECVDHVICRTANKRDAQGICDSLNAAGFSCLDSPPEMNPIDAELFVDVLDCDIDSTQCNGSNPSGAKIVRFCGKFTLPPCPPPPPAPGP